MIITFIIFKQVVQRGTTFSKDMMLLKDSDIQMQLLLINVEKIAEEMQNAKSGL
jgi:hypothetical protein